MNVLTVQKNHMLLNNIILKTNIIFLYMRHTMAKNYMFHSYFFLYDHFIKRLHVGTWVLLKCRQGQTNFFCSLFNNSYGEP